jgi:hypothetical protein
MGEAHKPDHQVNISTIISAIAAGLLVPRPPPGIRAFVGTPQELRDLIGHVRAGKIKPIPIQNEPIEKINDGLERLWAGQVTGRIVHAHHA